MTPSLATGSSWSHSRVVAPITAGFDADRTVESFGITELEDRAQHCGDVSPVVHDRVDLGAVAHHHLHERIHRRGAHHIDRHRTTTDDVAELVAVGVATRRGVQVAHVHDIRPPRPTLPATLREQQQRVGGVRLTRLGGTFLARGAVHPIGLGVETVDERDPDLGWQTELARDHPLTIDPVAHRARRDLPAMQLVAIDRTRARPAAPRPAAPPSPASRPPPTGTPPSPAPPPPPARSREPAPTTRSRTRPRRSSPDTPTTPPWSPTTRAPGSASRPQCAPPTPHHRGHTPPHAPPPAPMPPHTPSPPAPTPRPDEHSRHPTSDPPRTERPRRAPRPTTPTTAPRPSSERAEPERKVVEPDPRGVPRPYRTHVRGARRKLSGPTGVPNLVNLRLTTSPRQLRVDACPLRQIPFP